MKVKTKRSSKHSIEYDGKDFELRFEPVNTPELKVLENGNIRVGYLAIDDSGMDVGDIGLSGKFHSLGRRHSN